MDFSVVIPTYNRVRLLDRALASAIEFCSGSERSEVIVVDDCSSDDTVRHLRAHYREQFESGLFKLVSRVANGGVTAAKNDGARAASGAWLIFLDSDDEFAPSAAEIISNVTAAHPEAPAIFLRCTYADGSLVGGELTEEHLDLKRLLRRGTPGECLPVVQRSMFLACPYDEDLRGFEGIAYFRLARRFGPVFVAPSVARIYHTAGEDRLSLRASLRRRACLLARGNLRILREFSVAAGVSRCISILARAIYYSALCATARPVPRIGSSA